MRGWDQMRGVRAPHRVRPGGPCRKPVPSSATPAREDSENASIRRVRSRRQDCPISTAEVVFLQSFGGAMG